jgi:hypothetical protein
MITREDLIALIGKAEDPSISLYLPTHRKGEEVQQDPIRFKNQLKSAEQFLSEQSYSTRQIEQLLEEPRKLLDKPLFWQHGDQGLAVFVTAKGMDYYRVPLDFEEQVLVDDHFLITPLLPMIALNGTFCILALSQKKVRLLKATRETTEPIALEEAPTSMEEFQQYDVYNQSLSPMPGTGEGKMTFHGWGDTEVDKNLVENYLKAVESEVTSILKTRNDPLVVAGVEEAAALYKKVNHYNRLMEESVQQNPDPLSDTELCTLGWKVIKGYFLKDMYRDKERFADLKGSDKQSDNLTQIVESAFFGKIESLFIPIGEYSWGWFDEERDVVHHSAHRANGEHDLINLAAIKTLTQGGNVYALPPSEMPDGGSAAAIFRYA